MEPPIPPLGGLIIPLILDVLENVRSRAKGVEAPDWGGEKEGREGAGRPRTGEMGEEGVAEEDGSDRCAR